MLTMPAEPGMSTVASIVGIDPGSTTLGFAVLYFDIRTLEILQTRAFTIKAEKLARGSWASELLGDMLGRIHALEEKLLNLFRDIDPFMIASESPFFSRKHPNAFAVLSAVIGAIRNAIGRYDAWKVLYLIDPPSVKNAVGAEGNAGKEDVKEKALALGGVLRFAGPVALNELDEHSIDAICVAYARYKLMVEELCLSK